jgi:hypothetical protein
LDNATGVAVDANLVTTFSENVKAGTGNIVIYQSPSTAIETIPVGDARVTISGATVTINPNTTLTGTTDYYVQIDATAFDDLAGNSYAGITNTTDWNFTTAAPPEKDANIYYSAGTNAAALYNQTGISTSSKGVIYLSAGTVDSSIGVGDTRKGGCHAF